MATLDLQAGCQPHEADQMPGPNNALMSRNVCYATTQQMEIVNNECYGCVPEK
jgi:hypothetical protein